MGTEYNYALEYTFDTLLKTFNPKRVEYMKKYYFYKLMNLVDSRLKSQGIDIKYPEYWYMFGPVTDFDLLDLNIDHGFTNRYFSDGDNVLLPARIRRTYDLDPVLMKKIDSTIRHMHKIYGYETGDKIKAECYKLNSPYMFNIIYQDFIKVIDNNNASLVPKELMITNLLNDLYREFPKADFPEIRDFFLEWDDTTRLVLEQVDGDKKFEIVKNLKNKFWHTFSKGVRLRFNQNIPDETIRNWSKEYETSIEHMYSEVEDIRERVILDKSEFDHDLDENILNDIMGVAYNLNA